jgi:hypothetical protein
MSTTYMENTTRPKDTEQQYQADVDPTLDSLQLLLREFALRYVTSDR